MKYPIVIHKDPKSDYGVIIPDLPGCYSAGESYDDAIQNAIEAAECHIEGLLIDGETIPVAGKIEDYFHKQEYKKGVWVLIDIDLTKLSGKSRRINITFPERLLKHIDRYAHTHGGNRSAILADAVLEYLAAHH